MSAESAKDALHLPSLSVKGLLGIPAVSIPELGRVTLIAGKNGSGKTTLLDAVRIYAARGSYPALAGVLRAREELAVFVDENDNEKLAPDLSALFHKRRPSVDARVKIGPDNGGEQLVMSPGPALFRDGFLDGDVPALEIDFDGIGKTVSISEALRTGRISRRWPRNREPEEHNTVRCLSVGPNVPGNDDMARFWDWLAHTGDEDLAAQALRLIYGDRVGNVVVVSDDAAGNARRVLVSIKGQDSRVPLRSLGDGAVRMFGAALALANSKDGLLLMDEVENGVHYSVQPDFWKMVMMGAIENNVQVFATTHSRDCIDGFT